MLKVSQFDKTVISYSGNFNDLAIYGIKSSHF